MLKKLFKYEFSATGRIFLPMYAALLVMSLIARVFYSVEGLQSDILIALITMLLVMLFTAVWVITFVIIIRRFWDNMLGRQGYLMNVLPVNPWEHVLAKMVTSGVWCVAGAIVSTLSFMLMLFGIPELAEIDFSEFFGWLNEAIEALREHAIWGSSILIIVQTALHSFVICFEFVLMTYAAMCIGQLANRHRVWASIGAYFGICTVCSLFTSLFSEHRFFNVTVRFPSTQPETVLRWINESLALSLLLSLIICVALFFTSSLLLKKKLNLQ